MRDSSLERFGTVWNGMERYGTVWNGVERYGTVWNDVERLERREAGSKHRV